MRNFEIARLFYEMADLEAMRKEVPGGLLALLEVRGLGPKTAKLLYDRLGIDSVEKLEQATDIARR